MNSRTRLVLPDLGRALAAAGVVAFHSGLAGDGRYWHLSDFFFVLSGFVLAGSFSKTGTVTSWSAFIRKRLYRFLPLIWVALIVKTILVIFGTYTGHECLPEECSPPTIIGAALLLQVFIPATILVLVPLWSLSVELFANMFFAAVQPKFKEFGVLVLIALGLAFLLYGIWADSDYIFGELGAIRGLEALGRGLIGIGVGVLIARHRKAEFSTWLFWFAILVTLAYFVSPFTTLSLLIAPLVFGFLIWNADPLDKAIRSERLIKLATWGGAMSFGIYVWHGVLIGTIGAALKGLIGDENLQNWAVFITTLAASLAMTTISYKYIETPAMRSYNRRK